MKAILTSKRFASVLALLLAVVMCFSACGKDVDTSSTDSDASLTDSTNAETTDVSSEENGTSSKEEGTSSKQDSSSKKDKTSNKVGTSSKTNSTTTTTKSTKWDADFLKSMPQSAKDKGIKILLWRDLHKTEQKVLDDFVAKTGCKVEKIMTTQKEYPTKLVSLISGKNSPDVCVLIPDWFPGNVVRAMQPLDATTFRLDDDCWNKTAMDAFKVNNKYFSVTMPGVWMSDDQLYVTYYQPSVLKECGVSTMPYELYKNGQWNWAAQKEIASKISAAGKDYDPVGLHSFDMFMLSVGQDFVSYDGKQFTNTLKDAKNNSLLTAAWQECATLNELKLVTGWDINRVLAGKVGLFTSISYGMYNEGSWGFNKVPGGYESIEVVPLAGQSQATACTPYAPKAWGVPKGAKNAEGAAYFLRYWLDVNNWDIDKTFINSQAKEVFNIINNKNHKKKLQTAFGITDYVTAGTYRKICNDIRLASASAVPTVLAARAGTIQTGINKANKDLSRIK